MGFIQIIEYETDRAGEVDALMRETSEHDSVPAYTRLAYGRDRDKPTRYLVIVEFPSYEAAMANSAKPETAEMAAKLTALCSSGPRFHNLDLLATLP
jgi:hypothetical protein